MGELRGGFDLLKKTYEEFMEDDCMSKAAAVAYYTVFSLPGVLVIVIYSVALVVGREQVEGAILNHARGLVGAEGAESVRAMIQNAFQPGTGTIATLVGLAVLLFGATGVMGQLQHSLNAIWEVGPDPEQGGIKTFITKRMLSFGMVLAIAFLLLVSFVISSVLNALGTFAGGLVGGWLSHWVLVGLNAAVSFGVFTLLFAGIYKVLPDAQVAWRDVWVGAGVTAILFVIGKFLIGLYLGTSAVGSVYGAAGSLVLILLWVYYTSLILFIGAEFTQVWANRSGKPIEPEPGAVRMVTRTERFGGGPAASPT